MHAGWAQNRVCPHMKARLFVVRKVRFGVNLGVESRYVGLINPCTRTSELRGNYFAFPESHGRVRYTTGVAL
jgi:hypothetical protein